VQRIENNLSTESTIKKELNKIIKSKKMSRVATLYFSTILDMCKSNPYTSTATKTLEITHNEYTKASKHLKKFSDISMKSRVDSMIKDAKKDAWNIAVDFSVSSPHPTEDKSIRFYKTWETRFNEDGYLTDTLSLIVNSSQLTELTDIAFQNGLLLYRDKSTESIYHIIIFPENNIPALALTPSKFD
jgi:hypothetical protein